MSLLFPLFLAGLGGLALPLLFHLVRRTPRGRQDFSSLMFLEPTPPRLTRRSRLDQILLLLLRLGALALLVLAFARPFLREAASLALSDLPGRRVALLLDVSASMRRQTLWPQAIEVAGKELDTLNPQDDVALYLFDDRLQTVLGFDEQEPTPGKADLIRQRLRDLTPTWGGSNLGLALATVAGELEATGDREQTALEPQIVLISDTQKGSRLEALEGLEWPQRVKVVVRPLSVSAHSNAHAHLLVDEEAGPGEAVRVRVANSSNAEKSELTVGWKLPGAAGLESPAVPIYVPPGQSRVIRLPRPVEFAAADRIVLHGDDDEFDNQFFVVPPARRKVSVMVAGNESPSDTRGLTYYLKLATAHDLLRQVEIEPLDLVPLADPRRESPVELVIIPQAQPADSDAALLSYVEGGGVVLLAPIDQPAAESLPRYFDQVTGATEARSTAGGYLLLGDIDFSHPLFTPFASPPYSDFTRIHFWRTWKLELRDGPTASDDSPASVRVVARFDNGDPALLERRHGSGRLLALTSSWRPADSQLALSSKFVAFMGSLLDLAAGDAEFAPSLAVHESAPLPAALARQAGQMQTPAGTTIPLAMGDTTFPGTDLPGIYEVRVGEDVSRFAVNLASAESQTAPLELEQLELRGVRLGTVLTRAERIERVRQQRDTELEGRQKLWRWLLVGTLLLVILETLWASRAERAAESLRPAA